MPAIGAAVWTAGDCTFDPQTEEGVCTRITQQINLPQQVVEVVAVLPFTGRSMLPVVLFGLSLVVLAAARHLPSRWFGPVSHSIYAAFAHIAGQMAVVYLWLIPHAGIAYLIPVFAAAALAFGVVNGLIAARFMNNAAEGFPAKPS